MGITHDDFIRTTSARHKRGVQKLFKALQDNGKIELRSYTGSYCVSDEAFVDLPAGTPCPDCGRLLETVTEQNYFFKLSEYQNPLINLIESGELSIQPESRRNEVLSFLRGGLKDLSVSRTSFKWGIPVPGDEAHVIYVWLDALANYMTALGYGAGANGEDAPLFQKFWPADLHIVGKEIIRFHCVYWPAFLLAAGLPLPKQVVAHGWLLFEESKMSKSRGNIVRTETILDAFGSLCPPPASPITPDVDQTLSSFGEAGGSASASSAAITFKHHQDLFASDILRYFLLREIPFGQDGSFSFDALITRYNADLANGYGNLVSRTLKLLELNFDGRIPEILAPYQLDAQPSTTVTSIHNTSYIIANVSAFAETTYSYAETTTTLQLLPADIMIQIAEADGYLSFHKPWLLAKESSDEARIKLAECLYTAAESIRIITLLLNPILPYATAKVWAQLGLDPAQLTSENRELTTWGLLQPGTKLGPLSPIFPRADKGLAQIMSDMESPKASTEPIACVTGPNDPPAAKLSDINAQHDASTPATDDLPVTTLADEAPSHDPAAGPRTTTLAEPNPGTHVAASSATTTERPGTPPHSEAQASGIFAGAAPSTQPTDASPQITIDDFAKVELRVAQVVVAERIPKADKLLRLEVDLGYEKRQILSGIAEWYTPEELVGRRIVVITNLAPRKMRGLESHGMLLAASTEGGKPHLATFADADTLPLGSRLK